MHVQPASRLRESASGSSLAWQGHRSSGIERAMRHSDCVELPVHSAPGKPSLEARRRFACNRIPRGSRGNARCADATRASASLPAIGPVRIEDDLLRLQTTISRIAVSSMQPALVRANAENRLRSCSVKPSCGRCCCTCIELQLHHRHLRLVAFDHFGHPQPLPRAFSLSVTRIVFALSAPAIDHAMRFQILLQAAVRIAGISSFGIVEDCGSSAAPDPAREFRRSARRARPRAAPTRPARRASIAAPSAHAAASSRSRDQLHRHHRFVHRVSFARIISFRSGASLSSVTGRSAKQFECRASAAFPVRPAWPTVLMAAALCRRQAPARSPSPASPPDCSPCS